MKELEEKEEIEDAIVINKEDLAELVTLYHKAIRTPMLYYGRPDTATDACKEVAQKKKELGEKYGFNHETAAINAKTGEVYETYRRPPKK